MAGLVENAIGQPVTARTTKETRYHGVGLNLDGGPADISTGIGFFDHMLEAFARPRGISG